MTTSNGLWAAGRALVLGAALGATSVLAACGGRSPVPAASAPERHAPVEVVTAETAPFTETYRVAAPARAEAEYHLSAEVGGTVAALAADVGQTVKAGQALARLDPEPLTLTRDTRRAEVERARVRLSLAEKALGRGRALHAEGTVADPALEEAELTARLAAVDLRLAELALKDAERDLAATRITAPVDGEITARFPEVGAVLAKGAPLFHLAATDRIRLVPGLSEREVVHVKPGDAAEVRFDALGPHVFTGEVARVGSVDAPGEAAFPVEVRVDNPERVIRPGMVARIALQGRTLPDAVRVPAVALRHGEGGTGVFIAADGLARRVPVQVAALVDETAVLAGGAGAADGGVADGMQVVVVGQTALQGGEAVTVTVRDGRPTGAEREGPAVDGSP
jgi:membrane fusion protein (multidrug efflux system)